MTTMTRRVFTGLGALATVQTVDSCSGSLAGSSGTGNRNAAASEVHDLVRMSPPSFDGVDLGHVSPDPSEVEGTVATATMDPSRRQCLFLWEEGKVPATTTPNGSGYDPVDFRPTVTSVPTAASTAVKGAVLLCAGGAFALRGDNSDCYPTAMIYSFYGRLSVAELNPDRLSGVVPTYYCYGTKDPFYDQFEKQVEVLAGRDGALRARVLDGWPHGFGAEGGWIEKYDVFLQQTFSG